MKKKQAARDAMMLAIGKALENLLGDHPTFYNDIAAKNLATARMGCYSVGIVEENSDYVTRANAIKTKRRPDELDAQREN